MSDPEWLPPLITLADCGGEWSDYLQRIYDQFRKDFVTSKPRYSGKRFALKRHPEYDGKAATFWHLISEGSEEEERTPNMRRCERIAWPRPMIERIAQDDLKVWRNERRGKERILLAIGDFSYLVVLDDRKDFILLWTAYYVEHNHRRRKLERDYAA